jgi:hypothetical protein
MGVARTRPRRRDWWDWTRFSVFHETADLFVLRETTTILLVIPKRLFASRQEIDQVGDLLRRNVAPLSPPKRAFEVQLKGRPE